MKSALWGGESRRLLAAVALGVCFAAPAEAGRLFTTDADFDVGVQSGVDHTQVPNQLQLSQQLTTFPILWVANAGEDTVSKFDSRNNVELARYRTWFFTGNHDAFQGPAPSRTAVDRDGNAYVLNRHFDGRTPMVMKILTEGGIERNGSAGIQTSAGSTPLNLVDNAPANSILDTAELADERVAWIKYVGSNNGLGRALCIGGDGHLWVGHFNARTFYKISSVDGSILAGPISVPWTPYGCVVDRNGNLYSASLSSTVGRIANAATPAGPYTVSTVSAPTCGNNYAIVSGFDAASGEDRIYLACSNGGTYAQCRTAPGAIACSQPNNQGISSTGIGLDRNNNIVVGQYGGSGGIRVFDQAGKLLCSNTNGPASDTRGAIVDSDNNYWQMGRTSNRMFKFAGWDGKAGCGKITELATGSNPYTYSDASGFGARNLTQQTGTWTVIQDGGTPNRQWGKISWNEGSPSQPAGSTIEVRMRTANTQAGLSLLNFVPVSNGGSFTSAGQFIEIQARLTANTGGNSPILQDLRVEAGTCDVDGDGDIDRNDIVQIANAAKVSLPVGPFDARDADGDGIASVRDARTCTLRCTRPNCATN